MSEINQITTSSLPDASLTRRILAGGGIAFVLIALLLSTVDETAPYWPEFWILRPLVIVPIAGAMGGLFYHFMDRLRVRGTGGQIIAAILSLIVYIIGLWFGTVVGLAGTLWN